MLTAPRKTVAYSFSTTDLEALREATVSMFPVGRGRPNLAKQSPAASPILIHKLSLNFPTVGPWT
jgi:hypothetical protein